MTHRVQPIRAKIEDLPLSASIECLDPPEQSQFSTHTTDLLSNIHHNICKFIPIESFPCINKLNR